MKEMIEVNPPPFCRDKCIYADSIACRLECAPHRDARFFVARPDLSLTDLAPFPTHDWTWNMSAKERQALVGMYLQKIVEVLTCIPPDPLDEKRKHMMMEAVTDDALWKLLGEISVLPLDSEEGE